MINVSVNKKVVGQLYVASSNVLWCLLKPKMPSNSVPCFPSRIKLEKSLSYSSA